MAVLRAIDNFDDIRKTIGPITDASPAEDLRWMLLCNGLIELAKEVEKIQHSIVQMREESQRSNVYR